MPLPFPRSVVHSILQYIKFGKKFGGKKSALKCFFGFGEETKREILIMFTNGKKLHQWETTALFQFGKWCNYTIHIVIRISIFFLHPFFSIVRNSFCNFFLFLCLAYIVYMWMFVSLKSGCYLFLLESIYIVEFSVECQSVYYTESSKENERGAHEKGKCWWHICLLYKTITILCTEKKSVFCPFLNKILPFLFYLCVSLSLSRIHFPLFPIRVYIFFISFYVCTMYATKNCNITLNC